MTKSKTTYETCHARTGRKGVPFCTRPAGWGTSHPGYGCCKLHGGSTWNHTKKALFDQAEEELMEVRKAVMGEAFDVDPLDALLWCVRITAGEVSYATWKVQELGEDQAILFPTEEIERQGGGANVADYERKTSNRGELNIWIQVRQNSVDRLARFSKMALDAGVAERAVRLAEHAGEGLAGAIRTILTGLQLTYEQELRAPDLVRSALEELEGPNLMGQGLLRNDSRSPEEDPQETQG